jgi:hypothetical protein
MLLSGCGLTTYGDAARDLISEKGAQAMDELLVNAEFVLCNLATIGAVQRRYGQSAAAAAAWKTICNANADVITLPQPLPD